MKKRLNHCRLIVFGRYPKPGTTKTRLIPVLGAAGAASLQRQLTEGTVAAARLTACRTGARLLFCHDGGTQSDLQRWLGRRDMAFLPQTSGDLGRRMYLALKTAFDQGARRVVLVGTDIPGLTPEILEHALDALNGHPLVLGPSTDGGYWLVGMTRLEDIFTGIAWGKPTVLEKTLTLARHHGLSFLLLDPLTDIDRPDDLNRDTSCEHNLPRPYLSVVVPTWNEERQLAPTLASALSPDAEILVSDGGSTDRTVEMAAALGARIIRGRRGRAGQQNRGAAAATGQVLLFLHADTRLPPKYVHHIFQTLMDRRTVLGAFRFEVDITASSMRWIRLLTNLRARYLQLPYGDQGLFMRRDDFQRVGGFPETAIAEDLFLVRRLARQGRISLAPAAAVTSARRWQRLGPIRTTLINAIIAAGCLSGVAPQRLAPLYRPPKTTTKP